jgi:hypothetical protein
MKKVAAISRRTVERGISLQKKESSEKIKAQA